MSQGHLFPMPPEKVEAAEKEIRQYQKEMRYDSRDFPIETIVSRYKSGNFFVPDYQREFIWNEIDQSAFIESVLMGLPMSMMFLAEDDDSTFEIVDGVQRIRTLEKFVADDLELIDLRKLTSLNRFKFSDLPEPQRNKFTSRALRLVILDQEVSYENRRDLFDRINKYGKDLHPSERRRGALEGSPFMQFLEECSGDKIFKLLCPVSKSMNRRREPLELTTRFFAYSEDYMSFSHDVDRFLDDFVEKYKDEFPRDRFVDEFNRTMAFVHRYFPYGFAKTKSAKTTPRVRFESIAIGVNLALRQVPDLTPRPVTEWLESEEFKVHTTTHASNSAPRMRGRIEYVRNKLLEVD